MRPIPCALLPHTATLADAAADGYAAVALTPTAELSRVRVEPMATETLSAEETQARYDALLLYDARNSRPRNMTFAPGQRVLFEGRAYRIGSVERFYDGRRLHHLEVTLVG